MTDPVLDQSADRPVCKICASPSVEHLYTSSRLGLPILQCDRCGLVFVGATFESSAQEEFYGSHDGYLDFANAENSVPEVARRRREWVQQIRRDTDRVRLDTDSGRKPRLLDVGCGAGDLLAVARDAGFDVHGIEISAPASALALEWYGIEVPIRPIEQDPRDDFFDVVTAIGVLEHVEDPRALLHHARRLLAPGGILFVYTPVWGTYDRLTSALPRITGGRVSQFIDRRINRSHLQIFRRGTIVAAMQQIGFAVVACDTLCEYNIPVRHYLSSVGVTHPRVQAALAGCLQRLIDGKLFFRNNMRVIARKL
jgi:cyclopropane fatty-acyl-phospholipid synthase-like methyltransferase